MMFSMIFSKFLLGFELFMDQKRKAVGGGPPTAMSRAPAAGLPTPRGASWIPCHAVEPAERGTWRTSSTC